MRSQAELGTEGISDLGLTNRWRKTIRSPQSATSGSLSTRATASSCRTCRSTLRPNENLGHPRSQRLWQEHARPRHGRTDQAGAGGCAGPRQAAQWAAPGDRARLSEFRALPLAHRAAERRNGPFGARRPPRRGGRARHPLDRCGRPRRASRTPTQRSFPAG